MAYEQATLTCQISVFQHKTAAGVLAACLIGAFLAWRKRVVPILCPIFDPAEKHHAGGTGPPVTLRTACWVLVAVPP